MALPTQYARAAFNFTDTSGKIWENVFWYELGGTFGSTYNIQNAATALQAHVQTEYLAVTSIDVTYSGLDLRINNHGVSSDASTFPALQGTGAAGASPSEVAVVVHWQTANPGGSGRGRSYFAGMQTTWVYGGRVTTGGLTAFNALAAKLLLAFTDQGITWGLRLYSRKLTQMIPTASYVVDGIVGTQRRRRPRR